MSRCYLLLTILIAAGPFAGAAPILSTQFIVSSIGASGPVTNYCFLSGGGLPGNSCNGTATVIPASGAFGGTFLNYSTLAVSDYGVLGAFTDGSLSVPQPSVISTSLSAVSVNSIAAYRDQWTVFGGTAGNPGTLVLTFMVEGSFGSNSPLATASAAFNAENFTTGQRATPVTLTQTGSYQVSIPITLGQLFDYDVEFQAVSLLRLNGTGGVNGEGATVGLLNTARITGISVLDQGTSIPFTFTTASGSPNFNVTTPEPASMALLAVGLLGLAAKRLRKGNLTR